MISTLADDAITLHYQPLAECHGAITGLEALMRWHHRQRGAISPEAFIPIFEKSGLIVPLSRWALAQSCRDAASWKLPLNVAVNLSAIQFDEEDLPALIGAVLAESGLAPGRLELEMTEAALISNTPRAAATMARLRALGIGIALDDFGTGLSALSYLKDYPFSKIKIDGRVIAGIENSASARSIIHMTIELGHSRDLAVAAEGVETSAQLAFLRDQGCDMVQGFLIGRPAPIADYAGLTGNPSIPITEPVRPGPRARATAVRPPAHIH